MDKEERQIFINYANYDRNRFLKFLLISNDKSNNLKKQEGW